MSDAKVNVRRLGPDDWQTTRDLRLAALKSDERWFGGNYADSAARTEQQWRDWPDGGAVFAACVDDVPRGIVAGVRPEHLDGQAELISMWVGSAGRGRGLSARLTVVVADWARDQGCTELYLEVMPHNESAYRAYTRFGFAVVEAPVRNAGDISMRYRLLEFLTLSSSVATTRPDAAWWARSRKRGKVRNSWPARIHVASESL